MKREIKNTWIKALRSGEFKQTYGQLEVQGEYCALGVLSVLALLKGICTYDLKEDGGRFDNRRTTLSYNVMNWAGIKDFLDDPEACKCPITIQGIKTSIADLKDQGLSFEELAIIIDAHWKEL
jgi:hypothetical protein